MAAVGLKSYILNNNIKSAVLLAGFPVLLVLLVYALELIAMGTGMLPRSGGGLSGDLALPFRMLAGGIPLAFAVAAIWFVIAYFFQSARNRLVSPLTLAKRSEAKTICLPSLVNIGKPSKSLVCVIRSRPVPSTLIMKMSNSRPFGSP